MRGPKPVPGYRMDRSKAECIFWQNHRHRKPVATASGTIALQDDAGNMLQFCRICCPPIPRRHIQKMTDCQINALMDLRSEGPDLICSKEAHAAYYAALREREMRLGVEGAR